MINRRFGVMWEDLVDIKKEPCQAVRVIIYMPRGVAELERSTIAGIETIIRHWNKVKTDGFSQ